MPPAGEKLEASGVSAAPLEANAGPGPVRTAAALRLAGLALATGAASLAFALDWHSPIRVLLVFSFLLFGPGLALAEALEIRSPVQQFALAVSVSLGVETLVAVALIYAGEFSVGLAFATVAVVTALALAVAGLRVLRSPASDRGALRPEGPEPAAAAWSATPDAPEADPAPPEPIAAPPPDRERAWTAEIEWRQAAGAARFCVVARPASGAGEATVARSAPFDWPPVNPVAVQEELTDMALALEASVVAAGWKALPPGRPWYARRFAWEPVGSAEPGQSESVQQRARSSGDHAARGRGTPRNLPVAAVSVLVLAAVFAGLFLGESVRDGDGPAARVPDTIDHGGLRLLVPSDWTRADLASVPGFRRPLELRNRRERLTARLERLPATSFTLLPVAFVSTLKAVSRRPDVVRLAAGQPAWRYSFRTPDGPVTVIYVAPTTSGVATVSCSSPREARVPRACAELADAVTLPRSRPLDPESSGGFYSRVPAAVADLKGARARSMRALAGARRPPGQAAAAESLARAHRAAAAALAPLSVKGDGLPSATADALSVTARAYATLSRAARTRSAKRYADAAGAVARSETDLRRILARLATAVGAESRRVAAGPDPRREVSDEATATALLPAVVHKAIDEKTVFAASESFGVITLVLVIVLLLEYAALRGGSTTPARLRMLSAVIAPLFIVVMLTLVARIDALIS